MADARDGPIAALQSSITANALCDLVHDYGPVAAGTFAGGVANRKDPGLPYHMLLVLGLTGKCGVSCARARGGVRRAADQGSAQPSGKSARVVYVDPADGKKHTVRFSSFLKRMEEWHSKYVSAIARDCAQVGATFAECEAHRYPLAYAHLSATRWGATEEPQETQAL